MNQEVKETSTPQGSKKLLNLLILGQGKGRLAIEAMFGQRLQGDLNFCHRLTLNPKEADVLMVTGPIGPRLSPYIESVFRQIPGPKKLVVVGTEALNGGIFDEMTLGKRREIWSRLVPDEVIYGEPPVVQEICEGLMKLRRDFYQETEFESGEEEK